MSNRGKCNLLVRRWEYKFLKHLVNPLDFFNVINEEFAFEVIHVSNSMGISLSIALILTPFLASYVHAFHKGVGQ